MARLQKYKSLIGFDAIEDFYGEPINGAYVLIENFERSFCKKCGKVTATMNDMCDCGATKFMRMPNLDYWAYKEGILASKTSTNYDATTDIYTISAKILKLKTSNRDDYEVFTETKDILSFGRSTYVLHEKDLLRNLPRSVMDDYKYKEEIKSYTPFFTSNSTVLESLDIYTTMKVMDALKDYPNFITDPDSMRFKYLTNYYIRNVKTVPNDTFVKVLSAKSVNPKYFEILDKFCKSGINNYGVDYEVLKGVSPYYYYRAAPKYTFSEFLDEQSKNYSKVKGHIWNTLYHHLLSGAINLSEFCNILNDYNYLFDYDEKTYRTHRNMTNWFDWENPLRNQNTFCDFWKKDYIKLFPTYLKENLYGKETPRLIARFVEDLYQMEKASIPIEEESLKLKNFNYNLNERNLSTYLGIAPEKIEVFLDTFDRNPLASVSLLKDRRKLTKKQMDEYMELLDKDE